MLDHQVDHFKYYSWDQGQQDENKAANCIRIPLRLVLPAVGADEVHEYNQWDDFKCDKYPLDRVKE
jgi:hypothetical protein